MFAWQSLDSVCTFAPETNPAAYHVQLNTIRSPGLAFVCLTTYYTRNIAIIFNRYDVISSVHSIHGNISPSTTGLALVSLKGVSPAKDYWPPFGLVYGSSYAIRHLGTAGRPRPAVWEYPNPGLLYPIELLFVIFLCLLFTRLLVLP